MGLLSKVNSLTEMAGEFEKRSDEKLTALMDRIEQLDKKRDEALDRHGAYYDKIEQGLDQHDKAIERLSNLPLEGGESGSKNGSPADVLKAQEEAKARSEDEARARAAGQSPRL